MAPHRFTLPFQTHRGLSRRSILTTGGALLAAGLSSAALSQTVLGAGKTPPHLRFLQPDASSKQAGYSHVVEATVPGRIVYIAGQMGLDSNGSVVGAPGDFKAQARAALQALKAQVEAGGGTMASIVKVNTYLTDIRHRADYGPIREEFFGKKMPASTLVAVAALAQPEFLIEIEAVAVI